MPGWTTWTEWQSLPGGGATPVAPPRSQFGSVATVVEGVSAVPARAGRHVLARVPGRVHARARPVGGGAGWRSAGRDDPNHPPPWRRDAGADVDDPSWSRPVIPDDLSGRGRYGGDVDIPGCHGVDDARLGRRPLDVDRLRLVDSLADNLGLGLRRRRGRSRLLLGRATRCRDQRDQHSQQHRCPV